jgi:hypothetical protein
LVKKNQSISWKWINSEALTIINLNFFLQKRIDCVHNIFTFAVNERKQKREFTSTENQNNKSISRILKHFNAVKDNLILFSFF